jgi:dimethylhistidine N-methyltransferase
MPEFVQLHHEQPAQRRDELAAALSASAPSVPHTILYDSLGSRLFEAITELDEYYPTRTEAAIFAAHAEEMAEACGRGLALVDLGAGNCAKAEGLFDALRPVRYVAVDISVEFLRRALDDLQRRHPALPMLGVGQDFSARLALPAQAGDAPRLMFYPGSSIGNFSPADAQRFLAQARDAARGGSLLIGVDLVKDAGVLQPAYDDPLGVTAAFNLNLLRNLNRWLGSDFDVAQWQHVARYDIEHARIEMHLRARSDQLVRWAGGQRRFAAGDSLHTENSYKYTVESFAAMLRAGGFAHTRCWTDERGWFAVFAAR